MGKVLEINFLINLEAEIEGQLFLSLARTLS